MSGKKRVLVAGNEKRPSLAGRGDPLASRGELVMEVREKNKKGCSARSGEGGGCQSLVEGRVPLAESEGGKTREGKCLLTPGGKGSLPKGDKGRI